MASATNSSAAEPGTLDALDARLRGAHVGRELPLLAFRLPGLGRTAWREGRRVARAIERRAAVAFGRRAGELLRRADLVAHDAGSDVFVAALLEPARDGARAPAPVEVRRTLARIAATIETAAGLEVDVGWTHYVPSGPSSIAAAVTEALVRGAQERERYAFFSAVGHELRTPLASIRGYLETLLDDDVAPATQRHFMTIAYQEALRLGRLLDGMFEISLLDLSGSALPLVPARLDIVLGEVAAACAASCDRRRVTLALPTADSTTRVSLDDDRLTLVLVNLVENAIKHGRCGGRVAIDLDTSHPRTVTLAVDDDGPGIGPAQRERVFALGERGRTEAAGNGIGLALVRLIVERAGGRVAARESALGGARFAVTLPRC